MTAVLATFSDFKIVKGRKVAQLILEVPLEGAQAALEALGGVPQPDSAQWVGIAPVDPDKAQKPAEKPKGGRLAMRAGILCGDLRFAVFVMEKYNPPRGTEMDVTEWLRVHCGVKSRADLDHNEGAGEKFMDLEWLYRDWLRS